MKSRKESKFASEPGFSRALLSEMHALMIVFFGCLVLGAPVTALGQDHTSWSDYGGGPDSSQYSPLREINRSNVSKLEIAWTFPTGDDNRYFFNPVQAHGLTYVLAANNSLVALKAETGKEVWVHQADPHTEIITDRGINYWESKDGSERRLLFASNHFLQAIDARTGKSILSFGTNGQVDLKQGLGRDPGTLSLVQSTTPGRVFENLLILGSATNQGYGSAPGDIRAFDVRSGKLVWTFHTIPHPGEFGYDTWPKDAWKRVGGANCWGEISVDEARGIVYVPTASPKYNFYGADRRGADLFGDCLLALNARTGKLIWYFQMVHHDIWDYDNTAAPKLLTLWHNGRRVNTVAQVGKTGFVWVFDRDTGKPLWPVEERPEPRSDMPGEETWPTQPFPLKPPPFARQAFTAADLSPLITDPQELARFRQEIETSRNQGLFTPPALTDTMEMPGNSGGANWGSAAADPANGTLYVASMDLPCMLKLEPEETRRAAEGESIEQQGHFIFESNCRLCHGGDRRGLPPAIPSLVDIGSRLSRDQIETVVRQGRGPMPGFPKLRAADFQSLIAFLLNPSRAATSSSPTASSLSTTTKSEGTHDPEPVRYLSGFGFMMTSMRVPPIKPPWSSLTAYDLNKGTIKWKIPLGEVPELAAKGIQDTGFPFLKTGPVVTAGGLIFTATRDHFVRAYDEETGKVLWEKRLDTALQGIPSVYEAGGREYLVVCAAAPEVSDAAAQGSIHGAYVAFALPTAGTVANARLRHTLGSRN
ncbi:MAG TPA: pyrroloquinoline quinone-dependent dehydrogenase [Terriglobia bacterium]|nr:pyrroloquinoline quinone-dependent dehydrogenase [Terriglobia bacterium]